MSGKTREQQLDELLDKQAIYELIMAYCNAADRHDHVKMRTLYHEDAIDDHGHFAKGLAMEFIDKNYGGILVLWDRLFGTFADERDDEKICYGIRKPLHSFSPIKGNLHYYADLWQMSRAAKGWRAKLGVWVAPPGGWTDEPIEHFEPRTFTRFDVQTPAPLRWYVALQYAVLVPFVSHFIGVAKGLDRGTAAVYALGILVTAVALGALLERFVWGKWLEQVRLLALGVSFAAVPQWFGFEAPLPLKGALLVLCVGSVVWLNRQAVAPANAVGVAA